MKKQKELYILGAMIVAVILIIIVAVIGVRNAKIKQEVNAMFFDIKSGNVNKMTEYIKNEKLEEMKKADENENAENAQLKVLFEQLNYKIKSVKVSSNNATVLVEVNNKNIEQTLTTYFKKALTQVLKDLSSQTTASEIQDKLTGYLKDAYNNSNNAKNDMEVKLVKENGRWIINNDEETSTKIMNAILPGYLEYSSNLNGTVE